VSTENLFCSGVNGGTLPTCPANGVWAERVTPVRGGSIALDANGLAEIRSRTTSRGKKSSFTYDGVGRLASRTEPDLTVFVHNPCSVCAMAAKEVTTTAIGKMKDLKAVAENPAIDSWAKSGRMPGPGEPRVSWAENRAWLQERIERGDSSSSWPIQPPCRAQVRQAPPLKAYQTDTSRPGR
jgi:hypothetical protein